MSGLSVTGREIIIEVDLSRGDTQMAVLTKLVVTVDDRTGIDNVQVIVTTSSLEEHDVNISGQGSGNAENVMELLAGGVSSHEMLLSFKVTIKTKDGRNRAQTIRVSISAVGCFTPTGMSEQTAPVTSAKAPLTSSLETSSTTPITVRCQPNEMMCRSMTDVTICAKVCDGKAECKHPFNDEPADCQVPTTGVSTGITESTQSTATLLTESTSASPTNSTAEACSEWSNWSACDVSCGPGYESRSRHCPGRQEDIRSCFSNQCYCVVSFSDIIKSIGRAIVDAWADIDKLPGFTSQDQQVSDGAILHAHVTMYFTCGNCTCKDKQLKCFSDEICEKDCQWSTWEEWSDCTGACDTGIKERSRNITRIPSFGGKPCEPNGKKETKRCDNTCICKWSEWSPYSICSKQCGGGTSTRQRRPLNSVCVDSVEQSESSMRCNMEPCQNGTTTACGDNKLYAICHNVTCSETCVHLQTDGLGCDEKHDCTTGCYCAKGFFEDHFGNCVKPEKCCDLDKAHCNECEKATCQNGKAVCLASEHCDCVWDIWKEWSPCDKSCGPANSTRVRSVKAQPRGDGESCIGPDHETNPCEIGPCPYCTDNYTDANVSAGSPMTPDSTCQDCVCDYSGQRKCEEKPDASKPAALWTDWCQWTGCAGHCPNGTRTRARLCYEPCAIVPARCEGLGVETEPCHMKCQMDCQTGPWQNLTACSAECCEDRPVAYGIVQQVRDITVPAVDSPNVCQTNRTVVCQIKCPVNCKVISFVSSPCAKLCAPNDKSCDPTCGTGLATKTPLDIVQAQNGGQQCQTVYEPCDLGNCTGTCLAPKQMLSCVDPCQHRCADLSKPCVNTGCVQACACPDNKVEQAGECVDKSQCHCTWNQELLGAMPDDYDQQSLPGTVFTSQCNTCTCRHGKWACSSNTCKQDCRWDEWKQVTACNADCGEGYVSSERTVLVAAKFGGAPCTGPTQKNESCYGSNKCCEESVIFAPMNTYCEMSCDDVVNIRNPGTTCPAGCRCQPGFVRDIFGRCVPSVDCLKCQFNGKTWKDGEFVNYLHDCKFYGCARGKMLNYPLAMENGLPPCTAEDFVAVANGQRSIRAKDKCCYLAVINRCDVSSTMISEIRLSNGDICKLPDGKFLQSSTCHGGCTAAANVIGAETQEDAVVKHSELENLLRTDPTHMPEAYVEHSCACCLPTEVRVNSPRQYTCVNQRTKHTVQGYYIDYKITKCECR